jgi:hypothetical protein
VSVGLDDKILALLTMKKIETRGRKTEYFFEYKGVTYTAKKLMKKIGLGRSGALHRIQQVVTKKWTPEEALNRPRINQKTGQLTPASRSKYYFKHKGEIYDGARLAKMLGMSPSGACRRVKKVMAGEIAPKEAFGKKQEEQIFPEAIVETIKTPEQQAITDEFERQTRNQDKYIAKYYAPCDLDKKILRGVK